MMDEMLNLPHLVSRVFGTPLLIEPAKLETILHVLEPRLLGGQLSAPFPQQETIKRSYQVLNGVGIIPIVGTLVNRGGWLGAQSGMTSYQGIESMLASAVNDPAVQSILLDIDSPGGEVAGCFDLADRIYAAREKKPIWAYANDRAASAAYALASAAEKIYATRTAFAGSIGVMMTHIDASGFDAQKGLKYTHIYAGAKKVDGSAHTPLSDSAKADIQAEINGLYDLFVATVARNRGLSPSSVRGTEAGMFRGENAVSAGLVDVIGTFDDLISAMDSRASQFFLSTPPKEISMSNANDTVPAAPETPTPAPVAVVETPEAAAARGMQAERGRISGILAAATKLGVPLATAQGLIDQGVPLEAAKDRLIDAVASQSAAVGIVTPTQAAGAMPSVSHLPVEERTKAEWDRNPDLRAEFGGNYDSYLAFERADEQGLVRLLKKN